MSDDVENSTNSDMEKTQQTKSDEEMQSAEFQNTEIPVADAEAIVPLLQALLLSSSDPLDLETLTTVCEVDQTCVSEALKILSARLESDNYGFSLIAVAKGFQFRTKPRFGKFIRTLKQESPRKLSPAALETLAVVAYRQPVVKHDIDGLRGVDVMPTLKTLLDRGLLQVVGHKETVGHPSLYGTTDEFLRVFGLNSIKDLPSVKELNQIQNEPGEDGAAVFENPLAELVSQQESEEAPNTAEL